MTTDWQPGCLIAVFRHTGAMFTDGVALNVWGVINSAPLTLTEVATELRGAWEDHILPGMSDAVTLADVTVFNETQTLTQASGVNGDLSGSFTPVSVCVLGSKRTAQRGPRAHGRVYVPMSLRDGDVDERGLLGSGIRDDWQSAMTSFLTDVAAADLQLALPQSVEGESAPLSPWPVITSIVVDGQAATQRRRMRR